MRTKFLLFLLLLSTFSISAKRKDYLINNKWMFRYNYQVQKTSECLVNLPHTWNALDADARQDYYRGVGTYTKELYIRPEWKNKRLFLRFEGANTITNVFMNNTHIGEHRGGYTAFVFEITDKVHYGKSNKLTVKVNNALQLDIMPLVGDFNFYGGIYRDVHLVITDPVNISLTDYASPGVYLMQRNVSKEKADIQAKVKISNGLAQTQTLQVRIRVNDAGKTILEKSKNIELPSKSEGEAAIDFTLDKPHLWNGRKDPFMYQTEVTLLANGQEIDQIIQPLGLRYYSVDANKGFILNGEHLSLLGVCRHQERNELGNALRPQHHEEDLALITEMGANAIRLSHYPQSQYFIDLLDKAGLVAWSEIPFVGPGGYQDRGFVDQESFKSNGKQQLIEMIRQQYNHPSVCFWGLFNELKTEGDNPTEYLKELNEVAHKEDPTRLTTAASFLPADNQITKITDIIAWNKYYGWYGGNPSEMGQWLDKTHQSQPELKIAISEYGAGASIYHQQDSIKRGIAAGYWHPENYQTYYHMENWKAMAERKFIWGTFIWNMFDFGAAHRTEGDRSGVNDKGLVTRDRKVKKDAFYFYKANWNNEDKFVYISNRRHTERVNDKTDIMVFTNQPEAELLVNGKSIGRTKTDNYATCLWKNVQLQKGKNIIRITSGNKKNPISDEVIWNLR